MSPDSQIDNDRSTDVTNTDFADMEDLDQFSEGREELGRHGE